MIEYLRIFHQYDVQKTDDMLMLVIEEKEKPILL